ncbi:MAG: aspartate/glutamate racemase family protein [Devosia sp.]
MPRISCLHTAETNIVIFEAARRQLRLDDVVLRHRVRADLLAAAEKPGGAIEPILRRTAAELGILAGAADAVLLTCSTLGPAAALAQATTPVPILRVDQALAREAVKGGGTVIVLCAAGTTITPTRALFERAALLTGAEVEVRLVPGAWERFKAGDQDAYLAMIADAADIAAGEGAATIALTQASMAGAAKLCREVTPLTSPAVGLAAAVAAAQAAAEKSPTRS